jgi:putative Holliday junction resolvase
VGRVLALDYGKKRVGIAVSDPLKITANGLDTVETNRLREFLKEYLVREDVECLVVGFPKQMNNKVSEAEKYIVPFLKWFANVHPDIKIERMDERFTSVLAGKSLIEGGAKKMARRNKSLVDKISAVIILQSYLETLKHGMME